MTIDVMNCGVHVHDCISGVYGACIESEDIAPYELSSTCRYTQNPQKHSEQRAC